MHTHTHTHICIAYRFLEGLASRHRVVNGCIEDQFIDKYTD